MQRLLVPLLVVLALLCVAGGFLLEVEQSTTKAFGFAAALISVGPMLVLIAIALKLGPERQRSEQRNH